MSADDELMVTLAAQLDKDEAAALSWPEDQRQWAYDEILSGHATAAAVDVIAAKSDEWWTRIHILDGDPELADHIARHDPFRVLREITAKRAVLAEHLPIETGYGLTCKRCVSWQDDEGQHEFGIAIPEPWPCLPVAVIAASSEQNLALAVKVLAAGRAISQAEFLAGLPYRLQAIADQLSMLLPDGLRLAWEQRGDQT